MAELRKIVKRQSQESDAMRPTCFIIGPIGSQGSDARKKADMLYNAVIRPVVEGDFILLRADKEQKPGMITDSIVQRVYQSELVIADLTGLNPNVFYELGIRHAAEKPTIHMATDGTNLPFDNAGYSTIFLELDDWGSIENGRRDLAQQVSKTREKDFKASNPVTQALTMMAFAASSDDEERSIALLSSRIEALERGRQLSGNVLQSDNAARLNKVIDKIEGRKKELRRVVEIIEENMSRDFDAAQIESWIERTAFDPQHYKGVLASVDDGNLRAIVDDIDSYIPF